MRSSSRLKRETLEKYFGESIWLQTKEKNHSRIRSHTRRAIIDGDELKTHSIDVKEKKTRRERPKEYKCHLIMKWNNCVSMLLLGDMTRRAAHKLRHT